MKLNKMPKEELELYSYVDLSKQILQEKRKPLNTATMFRMICDLLGMSEEEYVDQIGDYYTSLTTDKDFVLLQDATWDLRDHHPSEVVLDEEDDDEEIEEEVEELPLEGEDLEDLEDDVDIDEDETADLTIVEENELEK